MVQRRRPQRDPNLPGLKRTRGIGDVGDFEVVEAAGAADYPGAHGGRPPATADRKSTRLNSSHGYISYAVFCLKKKKEKHYRREDTARSPHVGAESTACLRAT